MRINDKIVEEARKWIGTEEISGNKGFKDDEFERRMKTVGWIKRQAWCVYYTEMVWKWVYAEYDSRIVNVLEQLFDGSALKTYSNFKNSPDFIVNEQPMVGSLIFWQYYKNSKPTWKGHAAIEEDHNLSYIKTIEGNTSKKGSREGLIVGKGNRDIYFGKKQSGLTLRGFVHPKVI